MVPLFPEFEALTGIKVNYEHLPENQFREKLLTDLSTKGGAYDGFMTGYITDWQYAGGGWIEPLDKYISDPKLTAPDWNFKDFFGALIKVNRWNGQPGKGVGEGPLYALPVNEEGYALFYRKDIFDKEGLRVPTTWDELISDAAKLNGKVYDGQKISGFVARGSRDFSSMTTGYGALFWSMGGQVMDPNTWKATVNNPVGVKAAEMWGNLMSKYAPEGVTSFTWYEAMQAFMKGSAAMFVDADHMAGSFEDPKQSSVVGKVGYAVPPSEGGHPPNTNIWIWSIGMSADSQNKEATWLFLQWASSKDVLVRSTVKNNINPCRMSVANDPSVLNYMKSWGTYSKIYQDLMVNNVAAVRLPSLPEFPQLGDIWATAIQSVILGRPAKQALDDGAAAMDKVLAGIQHQ
jgi:multiple sugar transport system substrate-binding protein